MSPRNPNPHLELVCIGCSGGKPDLNGASTLCALCLLEYPPLLPVLAAPLRPRSRITRRKPLELVCIVCSGGAEDAEGAYTVCALCPDPQTEGLPAAA